MYFQWLWGSLLSPNIWYLKHHLVALNCGTKKVAHSWPFKNSPNWHYGTMGLEAWRQIPASWCWKKPVQIEREAIQKLLQDVMVAEIWRAIFVFGVDCFFFWLPEVLYEWKSCEIVRRNLSYHIQMPVKAHDIWAKWNINNFGKSWNNGGFHPIYTMALEWCHPALAFWRFDQWTPWTPCPCRSLSAREDFHIGPAAKNVVQWWYFN